MSPRRLRRWPAWLLAGALSLPNLAGAEEPPKAADPAPADPAPAKPVDVKALFANQCSWCHGAYGMKADKGPKLAGTRMTEEQVRQRILNGKPGAMPSFRKVFSPEEVAAFARYIKSLPAGD